MDKKILVIILMLTFLIGQTLFGNSKVIKTNTNKIINAVWKEDKKQLETLLKKLEGKFNSGEVIQAILNREYELDDNMVVDMLKLLNEKSYMGYINYALEQKPPRSDNVIKYMIENGYDHNIATSVFDFLLKAKKFDLAKLFLTKGFDINKKDTFYINNSFFNNITPLFAMNIRNDSEGIKFIMENGGKGDFGSISNISFDSLLSIKRFDLAKKCINEGFNINKLYKKIDGIYFTPLAAAIYENNTEKIKFIRENGGKIDSSITSQYGQTAE